MIHRAPDIYGIRRLWLHPIFTIRRLMGKFPLQYIIIYYFFSSKCRSERKYFTKTKILEYSLNSVGKKNAIISVGQFIENGKTLPLNYLEACHWKSCRTWLVCAMKTTHFVFFPHFFSVFIFFFSCWNSFCSLFHFFVRFIKFRFTLSWFLYPFVGFING